MAPLKVRPRADPFAPLDPLLRAVRKIPLPPVVSVTGDDEWIVGEAWRRLAAGFRQAFPDGEVAEYEGTGEGVEEALADAATLPLFASHRLVILSATELFHSRKLTAEEVDTLLDEAREAGSADSRALSRLAHRARLLLQAAGVSLQGDAEQAARLVTGRVRRGERAPEMARLLAIPAGEAEEGETALDRLLDYLERATPAENVLLVSAVSPDPAHRATKTLLRLKLIADLAVDGPDERRARLADLGLEHALERRALVDPEVFEVLTERGRVSARAFLSELDRLIDTASGSRVTAADALCLVADERKEYGSDFVEAFAARRPVEALRILERLLSGREFTVFRPWGREEEPPGRKGPRGDAAFFPLLGLLAGEVRRMLALKAGLLDRGLVSPPRLDYRAFADRLLPALKAPRPGLPAFPLDVHPLLLHKAYLASEAWSLGELSRTLVELERIDRGVKSGAGTGLELLGGFLLARAGPAGTPPPKNP